MDHVIFRTVNKIEKLELSKGKSSIKTEILGLKQNGKIVMIFSPHGLNDTANNIVTTEIAYTIDDASPALALNIPANNYLTNETEITFNWTSNDTQDSTVNCSLLIDGTDIPLSSDITIYSSS